jgi:hypothetical protein
MAIGSVIQRGSTAYIYDEKGRQVANLSVITASDSLQGYTSTTVNIKRGSSIYTYDEKGRQLSVKSAR